MCGEGKRQLQLVRQFARRGRRLRGEMGMKQLRSELAEDRLESLRLVTGDFVQAGAIDEVVTQSFFWLPE